MNKTCLHEGCDRQHYSLGYCQRHYARLKRHGSTADPVTATVEQRFWSKVEKSEACWIWTGAADGHGYGSFSLNGKRVKPHRFTFAQANGPIESHVDVDHICHNRLCVNPEHLRAATAKQNVENHSGATRVSQSGVRGVFPHCATGLWLVQVGHEGRRHTVGYFKDMAEAEAAAIAKRNELHTYNNADRVS